MNEIKTQSVWRVTLPSGETCHFGQQSTATAWARETGYVEEVQLTPRDFHIVVGSADSAQDERSAFDELLGEYWGLAYSEGKDGVSHGDKANEVLHKLRSLFRASLASNLQAGEPLAIAVVREHGDYQATIDWLLNPLPDGTLLYAAPQAQQEAGNDSEYLNWLMKSEAVIVYSRDGDYCWLFWPHGTDEDDEPVQQKGRFNSPREAIDAAMQASHAQADVVKQRKQQDICDHCGTIYDCMKQCRCAVTGNDMRDLLQAEAQQSNEGESK